MLPVLHAATWHLFAGSKSHQSVSTAVMAQGGSDQSVGVTSNAKLIRISVPAYGEMR